MSREPLSPIDVAWLRMEDPTNMMMITGTMIFGAPIKWKRLRDTLEYRLLCFDRFRQRVICPESPWGTHYWEDDPDLDLDYHLQRIALTPPVNQATLQEAVSQLMSTQLDFSRPLWRIHLIEHYGKGSAFIVRLHHCIADGIALVHVLLSLADTSPDAPWPASLEKEKHAPDLPDALAPSMHPAIKAATRITNTLLHESRQTLDDPSHLNELAHQGTDVALALGRLVLRPPDPLTLFKGTLAVAKRAAWSKPVPLPEVKSIGRSLGGTVNDVLLTAVAGALGHYVQDRGSPVEGIAIRAVVPVNLRPMDTSPDLGNRFGLVFLTLPIGIAEPVERLREVKRCMDELKNSPEPVVALGLLNVMGVAPKEVQDIAVQFFATKSTAVMTNVPGPKEKLYLAGAPIDTIMFWVPQSGRVSLGVSILSYAGQVWLGIASDQGLVPDPEAIVAAFHSEFNELKRVAHKRQAKRSRATRPLTTTVDHTIEKMDSLLVKTDEPKTGCRAITRAGQPCRNRTLPGSEYCRIHQT